MLKEARPKSREHSSKQGSSAASKLVIVLNDIRRLTSKLEEAAVELRNAQGEYEHWKNDLPGGLLGSELDEKLKAICGLNLEGLTEQLSIAVEEVAEEVRGRLT